MCALGFEAFICRTARTTNKKLESNKELCIRAWGFEAFNSFLLPHQKQRT